jgi:hypothetical protein
VHDGYGHDQGLAIHRPHRERRGRLRQAKIEFARHRHRLLSVPDQLKELQRNARMLLAKPAGKWKKLLVYQKPA